MRILNPTTTHKHPVRPHGRGRGKRDTSRAGQQSPPSQRPDVIGEDEMTGSRLNGSNGMPLSSMKSKYDLKSMISERVKDRVKESCAPAT